jgi:hypothetical protein
MQYLSVFRGQKLVINISFSCAHENHVSVRDFVSGGEIFNANSHMNNNRHWESPVNTSPEPKLYSLLSFHKNTPPDGREPWYPSAERVVFAGPASRIIGYEDSTDGDFNDAVASVLWSIG